MPDLAERGGYAWTWPVSGAVTGLKAAKDLLQVALRTTVAIEQAAQIGTVLDHLGEVQDKLFDLRDELFQLQQEKEVSARN